MRRNPKREPNPSDPSSSDSSDDSNSSEGESGTNSQAEKERNRRKKQKPKNRCKSEASFGAWRTKPSDDSDEEVMRQSSVIKPSKSASRYDCLLYTSPSPRD